VQLQQSTFTAKQARLTPRSVAVSSSRSLVNSVNMPPPQLQQQEQLQQSMLSAKDALRTPFGWAVRSSRSVVNWSNTGISFACRPFEHARRERVLRAGFATKRWRKCNGENKGR
jgi:hypothetical protein